MKLSIQRYLETAIAQRHFVIAKAILRGEFKEGDIIFVDVEDERLSLKNS